MNIRTIITSIVAVMVLCVAQTGLAFTHKIINSTPYTASVKVKYATDLCKDESFDLGKGNTKKIKAGACSVSKIEATINVPVVGGRVDMETQYEEVEATPYKGPFSGDEEWVIAGPTADGKYTVTRQVN